MLETREREIDGVMYRVRQLTAPAGRRLLVRLYKVLGPPIGAALRGLPESGEGLSLGELQSSSIGEGLLKFADVITEEELENLVEVLASTTEFSPEPNKWFQLSQDKEFHFAGKYLSMFKWIAFALEVNYSDFLGGLVGLKGSVSLGGKESSSGSPTTSTGVSTESRPPADTLIP